MRVISCHNWWWFKFYRHILRGTRGWNIQNVGECAGLNDCGKKCDRREIAFVDQSFGRFFFTLFCLAFVRVSLDFICTFPHDMRYENWYGSFQSSFCNYTRSKSTNDRVWKDSFKFITSNIGVESKWPGNFHKLSRQTVDFIFFGWCQTEIDSESPESIAMTI